jgi:ParB-like chromosome segregation protein Spo0J
MALQINEKFEKLIPQLSTEQYTVLMDDINQHGIRDPLLVWNDLIVDGHHRYRIAQELGITDIPTTSIDFSDEDEAAVYIVKNQSMRRNLNMAQRLRFAFMLEPQLKKLAKEKQAGAPGARADVMDSIGDIAGVSRDTVNKYKFVHDKADEKQLEALENGELKINQLWKLLQPKEKKGKHKLTPLPKPLEQPILDLFDSSAFEKVEKATIIAEKIEDKWMFDFLTKEKREKKPKKEKAQPSIKSDLRDFVSRLDMLDKREPVKISYKDNSLEMTMGSDEGKAGSPFTLAVIKQKFDNINIEDGTDMSLDGLVSFKQVAKRVPNKVLYTLSTNGKSLSFGEGKGSGSIQLSPPSHPKPKHLIRQPKYAFKIDLNRDELNNLVHLMNASKTFGYTTFYDDNNKLGISFDYNPTNDATFIKMNPTTVYEYKPLDEPMMFSKKSMYNVLHQKKNLFSENISIQIDLDGLLDIHLIDGDFIGDYYLKQLVVP